jgi:hypothetical protein
MQMILQLTSECGLDDGTLDWIGRFILNNMREGDSENISLGLNSIVEILLFDKTLCPMFLKIYENIILRNNSLSQGEIDTTDP